MAERIAQDPYLKVTSPHKHYATFGFTNAFNSGTNRSSMTLKPNTSLGSNKMMSKQHNSSKNFNDKENWQNLKMERKKPKMRDFDDAAIKSLAFTVELLVLRPRGRVCGRLSKALLHQLTLSHSD